MNRPFSIARAVVEAFGDDNVEIIEGKLDTNGEVINRYAGMWTHIDPKTLSFNTGMTDLNGKEIFTGDILRHCSHDKQITRYEVEYLVEEGAFFVKHTEIGTSYSHNYRAFSEELIRTDRTHVIHERLTATVAKQFRIIAHMQDKEVPPLDEHDELFDPPTVESDHA